MGFAHFLFPSLLYIYRKYDVIPVLIDVAQGAVKEKVIRVIVATFRVAFLVPIASPIQSDNHVEPCDKSSCSEFTSHVGCSTSSICQEPLHAEVVG